MLKHLATIQILLPLMLNNDRPARFFDINFYRPDVRWYLKKMAIEEYVC